jgi:tetratricopeptide (TPR) repeat protein
VLRPLGDSGRILAALREAEFLAVALDDPRRLSRISRFLSFHFYTMGAHDQAVAAAQRALTLATAGGDAVLQARANRSLGIAYQAQGAYRRAIDWFGQAVASPEGTQRRVGFGGVILPAVHARAWLAVCHAELGTFPEGRTLGEEGLQIAEALAHPGNLIFASWGLGLLALPQSDLPRALPLLERAVGLCQEPDHVFWFPETAAALGAAYILDGRTADAVGLLTPAMEQATAMEGVEGQVQCHLTSGEAQALAGRLEEAHTLAERALALTGQYQERGNQAYALLLLGEIAARRDAPDAAPARAYYQQALALGDELGMRPLHAHCHHGLGILSAKLGRPEDACAELSAATELYCAVEMTFRLTRAAAALVQLR